MNKSLEPKNGSIHVKDFGAIPDNGMCDAEAIRKAIAYAKDNNIAEIVFDAGRYDLKIGSDIELDSKNAYVVLNGISGGLKLTGQTDEKGNPSTVLVRENPCISGEFEELPGIVFVNKSQGITLENLKFDNDPYYYSAGEVVETGEDYVVVEVLEGHPRVDGMDSWIIGSVNLENGEIVDGRISYRSVGKWEAVDGGLGRRMRLSSTRVADNVRVGAGLYWFFSKHGGEQIEFNKTEDIILRNLWSAGSSGMAYYFLYCRNILIETLSVRPEGNRVTTCPRDGLHLNMCSGYALINDYYCDGTNDDCINIHGQFFLVEEVLSDQSVRIKPLRESDEPLEIDTKVGFFDGAVIEHFGMITASEFEPSTQEYIVEFAGKLPSWIAAGTECVPYCFLSSYVRISNSTFTNTSTCGIIMKSDNTTIDNCRFYNIEKVAAFALCSFFDPKIGMMEASAADGVVIRNSTFDNCGRKARGGGMGGFTAIATDVGMRSGASIKNVSILNNTFRNMPNNCINIMDAKNVVITQNRFEEIPADRHVYVDEHSENVKIYDNSVYASLT